MNDVFAGISEWPVVWELQRVALDESGRLVAVQSKANRDMLSAAIEPSPCARLGTRALQVYTGVQ